MPAMKLVHPNGDVFTIELENGESVGTTRRERKGDIRGGTFSAKTPEAALKIFKQLIEEEKEFGYVDPSEKVEKAMKSKAEKPANTPRFTAAQWKKWWADLSDEWQTAPNKAADCDADENGFEAIANLGDLEAPEAGLDDLTPLEMLPALTSLNLYGNGFSSLKPLSKLKSLKILYIDNCADVEDLHPLSALTNLEELNVSYTSVNDLKPVLKLRNLKSLKIAGLENEFEDWSAELKALKKHLPHCKIITAE